VAQWGHPAKLLGFKIGAFFAHLVQRMRMLLAAAGHCPRHCREVWWWILMERGIVGKWDQKASRRRL